MFLKCWICKRCEIQIHTVWRIAVVWICTCLVSLCQSAMLRGLHLTCILVMLSNSAFHMSCSGLALIEIYTIQHICLLTTSRMTSAGPKEGLIGLAWHPATNLLAVITMSGAVHLWAQVYKENWSAFAPDFTELQENEASCCQLFTPNAEGKLLEVLKYWRRQNSHCASDTALSCSCSLAMLPQRCSFVACGREAT